MLAFFIAVMGLALMLRKGYSQNKVIASLLCSKQKLVYK